MRKPVGQHKVTRRTKSGKIITYMRGKGALNRRSKYGIKPGGTAFSTEGYPEENPKSYSTGKNIFGQDEFKTEQDMVNYLMQKEGHSKKRAEKVAANSFSVFAPKRERGEDLGSYSQRLKSAGIAKKSIRRKLDIG